MAGVSRGMAPPSRGTAGVSRGMVSRSRGLADPHPRGTAVRFENRGGSEGNAARPGNGVGRDDAARPGQVDAKKGAPHPWGARDRPHALERDTGRPVGIAPVGRYISSHTLAANATGSSGRMPSTSSA